MIMKRQLISFVSLLVLSLCAEAANYTVKQTGDGNFSTIQACANVMANGDTCSVYAGTYNENVTVPAGGVGAYKTLQVNGTDVVYVLSFVLNAHTKIIGFHVQNPSSPNSVRCVNVVNSATDVYITNNDFYACGTDSIMGTTSATAPYPSYVSVQNNIFSYGCSTSSAPDVCSAIVSRGDHWLIEGNDFSHITTAIGRNGSYGVVRNNTFHNAYGRDLVGLFSERECIPELSATATISGTTVTWVSGDQFFNEYPGAWVKISGTHYTIASVASYTSIVASYASMTLQASPSPPQGSQTLTGGNGRNCHLDFFSSEPSNSTQYNLIEGNTLNTLLGSDSKGILAQGDVCAGQCHHLIIRFNVGAHVGGGGIADNNANNGTVNPGFYHVKSYNNTWVDFNSDPTQQPGGGTNDFTHNSTNGANFNDIFYYPESLFHLTPITCAEGLPSDTCSTFAERNNLAWCLGANTGVTCNLHSQNYGRGNFTDDPGNIKADPLFVNYAANDFHLSTGSPAISAGSYLTTVAAGDSGSGTTLLVNDAGFFQDGDGIAGVKPDQIRVGTSTVAQITSVNYATNTLVLANSITRSPGNPVYLFSDSNGRIVLTGNAPDIGAFPSGLQQMPAPPTGLTVLSVL
jgi:hypothetical protein